MYELHYLVNIPIMSPQVTSLKKRKVRGNKLRNMEDAKRDRNVPINILSELHSHVQTRLISPLSSLEDCSSLAEDDELGLSFFLLAAASSISLCFCLSFSLKALLLSTAVWNSGPLTTGGLGGGFGGGGDGAFAASRGSVVWTNTY